MKTMIKINTIGKMKDKGNDENHGKNKSDRKDKRFFLSVPYWGG